MKYPRLLTLSAFVLIAACGQDSSNPLAPGNEATAKGGTPGKPLPPEEPIDAHPRFHSSLYSVSSAGFALDHAFKQVGLGAFSTISYAFTADFEAVYDCKNNGGQIMPESSPFHADLSVQESAEVEPSNGQVTATLTLAANPFADDSYGCPGDTPSSKNFRWRLRPETVKWTNIKFCWGQTSVMQGPVPNYPGANTIMTPTSNPIVGTPTDGDNGVSPATGIYSSTCLAG